MVSDIFSSLFSCCFASFEEIKILQLSIIVLVFVLMNIVMLRRLVLDFSMSGIMLLPLFVVFFASFRQVWLFAGKLSLRTNHAARGLRLFV
jgi:hypothetical protein